MPEALQRVFVGLGSNLDDPGAQVRRALAALGALAEGPLAVASFYLGPPLGGPAQPDYLNTACAFPCRLSPRDTLAALLGIERDLGRVRGVRWGPRRIDCDLLLHGVAVLDIADLRLPHPGIPGREFVLRPLLDLDPDLREPGSGRAYRALLDELLAARPSNLRKVG